MHVLLHALTAFLWKKNKKNRHTAGFLALMGSWKVIFNVSFHCNHVAQCKHSIWSFKDTQCSSISFWTPLYILYIQNVHLTEYLWSPFLSPPHRRSDLCLLTEVLIVFFFFFFWKINWMVQYDLWAAAAAVCVFVHRGEQLLLWNRRSLEVKEVHLKAASQRWWIGFDTWVTLILINFAGYEDYTALSHQGIVSDAFRSNRKVSLRQKIPWNLGGWRE